MADLSMLKYQKTQVEAEVAEDGTGVEVAEAVILGIMIATREEEETEVRPKEAPLVVLEKEELREKVISFS